MQHFARLRRGYVSILQRSGGFLTPVVTGDQAGVRDLLFPTLTAHVFLIRNPPAPKAPEMSDMTQTDPKSGFARYLPLIVIAAVALVGGYFLRDYLSFDTLRDNREALLAFRDANYLATVAVFMLAYVVIVGFSLPGATIATLTGGFLFATFPGALFNVTAATIMEIRAP